MMKSCPNPASHGTLGISEVPTPCRCSVTAHSRGPPEFHLTRRNAMPNVSSVNLSFLNNNKSGSAIALINLADFANGPLRLKKKVENGVTVTYLGVRSWSTYFFEKLIATRTEKANAKIKTQAAIEKHVRSFLNNGGLTFGRSAEDLTAALQSKVVGKSITPALFVEDGKDQDDIASTEPTYRTLPKVTETKNKTINGVTTVPTGLSVAVISPLKVIADVRLVTSARLKTHSASDTRHGLTVRQVAVVSDRSARAADFKTQYLSRLNSVAGSIETSVVLEVQPDSGKECSEANLDGAYSAAKDFIKTQRSSGKHVSIMLTVPKLPTVTKDDSPTVKVIDTAAKRASSDNHVLLPDDDTSSESEF